MNATFEWCNLHLAIPGILSAVEILLTAAMAAMIQSMMCLSDPSSTGAFELFHIHAAPK